MNEEAVSAAVQILFTKWLHGQIGLTPEYLCENIAQALLLPLHIAHANACEINHQSTSNSISNHIKIITVVMMNSTYRHG